MSRLWVSSNVDFSTKLRLAACKCWATRAGAFERVETTVVFQHLFNGDPGTDFPEIYERFFRHKNNPFNVLFGEQNRGIRPLTARYHEIKKQTRG